MPIEVQCEQGHRLSCPDEWAGKQGRCPKCGNLFQVPSPNGGPDTAAANAADDLIVFLCPSGHKLHGPPSLQGKPGQCPECGAKFRIPEYEEDDEQGDAEEAGAFVEELSGDTEVAGETIDEIELAEVEDIEEGDSALDMPELDEAASAIDMPEIDDDDSAIDAPEIDLGDDDLQEVEIEVLPDAAVPPPVGAAAFYGEEPLLGELPAAPFHPFAQLFAQLWQERVHGGVVEVHLEGGVVLLPDWWAQRLGRASHGVFAMQNADGTYVMETVPWEAVRRITVRQIKELPAGVFE